MKLRSFFRCLLSFLFFALANPLNSQELTAKQLGDKADQFSSQFLNDSALYYQRLSAEKYLIEGDTNFHYRFRLNAAFSLMRMNKLDSAFIDAQSTINEGADKMDDINLAAGYRLIGQILNLQKDTPGAQVNYQKALDILADNDSETAILIRATISSDKGILHYYNGNYAEAEKYWRGALQILNKISLEKNAQQFCEFSLNLNAVLIIRGASNESLKVLEAAEMVAQAHISNPENLLGFIYNSLGKAYESLGSQIKAIEYFKKSLSLLDRLKNDPNKALILFSIGGSYSAIGEFDLAFDYISQGIEVNKRLSGEINYNTSTGYIYLGQHYADIGDYIQAEAFLNKAMTIESSLHDELSPLWASACFNMSQTKLKQQDLDSAIYYAQKAVLATDAHSETGHLAAMYMETLGGLYLQKDQPDSAIQFFQKSLNFLKDSVLSDNSETALIFTEPDIAITSLLGNALAFERKYDKTRQSEYLDEAKKSLTSAHLLSSQFKQQSNIIQDKLSTQQNLSNLHKIGLRINYKLYLKEKKPEQLNQVLTFSQENKSNLILNQIQENISLENSGLPLELTREHDDIKASITYYEQALFYASQQEDSSIEISKYNDLLFSMRLKQDSIQKVIKKDHPNFYEAKFNTNHIEVSDIQKGLLSNELMLDYHIGDSSIYVLELSKTDVNIRVLPIDIIQNEDVATLLTLCQTPNNTDTGLDRFLEVSKRLYEALLPDEAILHKYDHLIIIPDAYISVIPFEVLANKNNDSDSFRGLNYLVKTHSISYANNINLLSKQNERLKKEPKLSILAFAPSFDGANAVATDNTDSIRGGLNNLIWTQREVESIEKYFSVKLLIGHNATEKEFRENSGKQTILHIASHGLLNEKDPLYSKLVFSPFDTDSINDGYLNTQELFNMKIPAEMVVLSACNSGTGDIVTGEGVLSLANGFFYAGSKSLVMSLWTANDQSTATVMDSFYKHLANGENKSTAMRNAKLEFLEEADELRSHPYYWGHMIVNGNNQPVVTKSQWWIYLVISLGIIVLVAASRRKRKSRP